jgi:hypothetical protein
MRASVRNRRRWRHRERRRYRRAFAATSSAIVAAATRKILFEYVWTGAPPPAHGERNRRTNPFINARNMLNTTVERMDIKAYTAAAIDGTAFRGRA